MKLTVIQLRSLAESQGEGEGDKYQRASDPENKYGLPSESTPEEEEADGSDDEDDRQRKERLSKTKAKPKAGPVQGAAPLARNAPLERMPRVDDGGDDRQIPTRRPKGQPQGRPRSPPRTMPVPMPTPMPVQVDPRDAARGAPDYPNGALGFGVQGDDCMYAHFDSLSFTCRSAVAEAGAFRHQYTQEEQESHHHPHFGVMLFILAVFGVFVYKKRFSAQGRQRREAAQETKRVLETVHGNVELKASVESAYGKPLPPLLDSLPKPPRFCCFLLRAVSWFLVVCFIANASGHITGGLMHNMVFKDDNGNEHPPPKPLILVVFLAVVSILVLAYVLAIRSLRFLYTRFCCCSSRNTDSPVEETSSSARQSPFSSAVNRLASFGHSAATASTGLMRSYGYGYVSPSSGTGYAPLSGSEPEDPYGTPSSEMTTFTPAQAQAQAQTQFSAPQHSQQQPAFNPQAQYYTGVPVQMPPSNMRYTYGQ